MNIKIKDFETSIEASNGYVNSISKGIGEDKLSLIIEKYSNLSIGWLLTGKGQMLIDNNDYNSGIIQKGSTGCHASITTDHSKEENDRCKMCKEKDLQIEDLKERIEGLKERINDQKEHIEELNNRISSLKEQLRGG